MTAKRGKPKSKKSKAHKRTKLVSVPLNLDGPQLEYVREIAEYAATTVELVCSVLLATGIYKARRVSIPECAPAAPAPAEPAAAPNPETTEGEATPDPNAPETVYA